MAHDKLTCEICGNKQFSNGLDAAIDAGWIPSYYDGQDEMEGPVCPGCVRVFLHSDPVDGEFVRNGT